MRFRFLARPLLLLLAMVSLAGSALSQTLPAIEFDVRFDDREHNYADVTATVPTAGASAVEVAMAVWTPGSYFVREYSGRLEDLQATNMAGAALNLTQTRKNRWAIETGGATQVRLRYRVYCREMSVRTNWVERDFAVLNGAPTFVTIAGDLEHGLARPHRIRLHLPGA